MRFVRSIALVAILSLTGCHSAWIDATVSNRTPETLIGVEVDYPSASFGTQTLAAGADFHYRFKVIGSGPTSLLWTDLAHHDHKVPGPALHENEEGTLAVAVTPNGAAWNLHPLNR
jgi:hypothetical protein